LAPEEAAAKGAEFADVLAGFTAQRWVDEIAGPLATDLTLALAQIESTAYLRNQLLRDSDWASMDHSVELRTPLVDAHLLAQLQPLLPQFRHHPGKTLLAQAPARPLPEAIVRRRKTGFAIPVKEWAAAALGAERGWQAVVAGIAR
jgi:asparagine synthase (glutamine-hydrolysing)